MMAMIVIVILEAIGEPTSFWIQIRKVGHDLCVLSIGIAGSMFESNSLRVRFDAKTSALVAISVVLANIMLAGIAMLITYRCTGCTDRTKGSWNVFLGLATVAIPSVVILYIGGH